jgi:hypothetical protein
MEKVSVHKFTKYRLEKRDPTFTEQLKIVLGLLWHFKTLILVILFLVVLGFMIPTRLLGY